MAGIVPNAVRDDLITAFRQAICQKYGVIPFVHQGKWWLASDGLELVEGLADEDGQPILLSDGTGDPERAQEVRWAVRPRPGGRARVVADLGAFKTGKSFGSGLWAASFGAVPGARVQLVGLEYDICAPEFDYICEFLLSERGMSLKYDSLQNRPRDGKMWLDLPNGARFEARSWERKESLKGKEIDAYLYCEAYQLPGIECYTSFNQNLRAREGYAVFATTPDRPWVKELHEKGHSSDPRWAGWACICGVDADVNPFTYDPEQRVRDQELMTREKFAIHYGGQLGDFVGRVFNYQRGQAQFSAGSHPVLFRGGSSREHLVVPSGWEVVSGADTGTYYTALTVAFSPDGDAFILDEFPNYRYVAGLPERDEGITIPQWARIVRGSLHQLGGRPALWADKNTQFKRELIEYGLHLMPSSLPVEARTEITREYFQHGKIWLAPWLEVLPFELEIAAWPEEASSTGKFSRVKDRDHTLDCLEHILSRRPRGKIVQTGKPKRWLDQFASQVKAKRRPPSRFLGY